LTAYLGFYLMSNSDNFSYLKAIQTKTTESVFAAGVKYYLYKKIRSKEVLLLPHWRVYQVKGQKIEYAVVVPVAHLLRPIPRIEILADILEETCTCECPYFNEYGVCKHIVAVCNDIDNEFELDHARQHIKQSKDQMIATDVFEKIFGVQQSKRRTEYKDQLFKPNAPSFLTREMVYELEDETQKSKFFRDFSHPEWEDFSLLFSQKIDEITINLKEQIINFDQSLFHLIWSNLTSRIGYYSEEKQIFVLVDKTSSFWRYPVWLWLILVITPHLDLEVQMQIHNLLYKQSFMGLASSFWTSLYLKYLENQLLDSELAEKLLHNLDETFGVGAEICLYFAYTTGQVDWLRQHIEELNNEYLIKCIKLMPDELEYLDNILKERVMVWLNYLKSDQSDYQKLSTTLHLWYEYFGFSEGLSEVLKTLKVSHAKKKNLLKLLKGLV
jgi:hypothetical protein